MHILALFLILVGVTAVYVGCSYTKIWSAIICGILFICSGGFILYLLLNTMTVFRLVFIVVILVGYIARLVSAPKREAEQLKREAELKDEQRSRQDKERKARQSEFGGTTLDRFFVECVLAKCNIFSLEKEVARAKLLADKYGLKYPEGIEALYESGLEAHEAISEKMYSAHLAKLRIEEKEEYDNLYRYASFYGRDKKIAILTDKLNELRKKASLLSEKGSDINKLFNSLMLSSQQKEGDWATMGGIANGLAGPAAGLATAMDIQARNAQIRAQNDATLRELASLNLAISQSRSREQEKLVGQINTIVQEIQQVKEKLISDNPSEEVFKKLTITNPTVEVSETGAFKVNATITTQEKLYIFNDVPAFADGTIIAHVFENGEEIGTATMVIPENGVVYKKQPTPIVGMSLSGAHKYKRRTVTFSPGNLWLMEK